jgi:NifB/MoaA-like Fe-S oxidoreductase
MGQDIIHQLTAGALGDLVVLPRITFDHPDRVALDDVAPEQISEVLNRPIVLAGGMGDVWDAVKHFSASGGADWPPVS